jgi:hypothetical protein
VAKILNDGSVITVNFNASLYSDCQSANVLYYCNHIRSIVMKSEYTVYFKIFVFIYCACQLTALHYTTVIIPVILFVDMLIYHIYMFTNRYMMY